MKLDFFLNFNLSINSIQKFKTKSASAGSIATFIILSFVLITGVGFLASYQNFVVESQEDYQEFQLKLLEASQIEYEISNISYNGMGNLSFIVTNIGIVDIQADEFSYFLNDSFLRNVQAVSIENPNQNIEVLIPSASMLIWASIFIGENQSLNIETVHDSSLKQIQQFISPSFIGEVGDFSVQNNEYHIISFQRIYDQIPALFMTPKTDNMATERPYVPIIHSINTTHANVSLCRDSGAATCANTYVLEEVTYMLLDVNKTNQLDWIEVGYINASTDGSSTSISFTNSFTNAPYVFSQSQTYNISNFVANGIGAHSWVTSIGTSSANLIGCDHPTTGNVCSGTATEEYAYLAIDPILQSIISVETGSVGVSNSNWASVSFSQNYSTPQILVNQNSDTGSQDPQYPWANNLATNGADVRYCEADAGGVCDSHSSETVRWLVIEEGGIEIN